MWGVPSCGVVSIHETGGTHGSLHVARPVGVHPSKCMHACVGVQCVMVVVLGDILCVHAHADMTGVSHTYSAVSWCGQTCVCCVSMSAWTFRWSVGHQFSWLLRMKQVRGVWLGLPSHGSSAVVCLRYTWHVHVCALSASPRGSRTPLQISGTLLSVAQSRYM